MSKTYFMKNLDGNIYNTAKGGNFASEFNKSKNEKNSK